MSLKRKSAELDDQYNSDLERAPKMIREQEQPAALVAPTAVPVILAPETENVLTEEDEAFFLDAEERASEWADLEVDEEAEERPEAYQAQKEEEAYMARMAAELEAELDDEEEEERGKEEKEESQQEEEKEDAEESLETRQALMEEEAYLAIVAAQLEAELNEDELIERSRSPSVLSDEDEDDDYVGNRKHQQY